MRPDSSFAPLYSYTEYTRRTFKVFGPAMVWLLLLVLGFLRQRWHGLWLLSGAAFTLVWPYEFTKAAVDCWRATDSYMCACWFGTAPLVLLNNRTGGGGVDGRTFSADRQRLTVPVLLLFVAIVVALAEQGKMVRSGT